MSRILENVHKSATALHAGGFVDDAQKREFDRLCKQPDAPKPTSTNKKN